MNVDSEDIKDINARIRVMDKETIKVEGKGTQRMVDEVAVEDSTMAAEEVDEDNSAESVITAAKKDILPRGATQGLKMLTCDHHGINKGSKPMRLLEVMAMMETM